MSPIDYEFVELKHRNDFVRWAYLCSCIMCSKESLHKLIDEFYSELRIITATLKEKIQNKTKKALTFKNSR